MSNQDKIHRSPASRVRVNGGMIKFIRENKGLTQLFIATSLGVTTDTISRWENGRYPTVKWENVERLAEALEVAVEDLLESDSGGADTSQKTSSKSAQTNFTRKFALTAALTAIVLLMAGVYFLGRTAPKATPIKATRFLPKHVAPGQPFPVVVRVESTDTKPFTFILEETLPENFSIVRSLPEIASSSPGRNTVKWICNSRQPQFFLAYLVRAPIGPVRNGAITFSGKIKAGNTPGFEQNVLGEDRLVLSNYHWVDVNSDNVIDDEEILTAFGSADVLRKLGVNLDLIKRIWSAGGYGLDRENNKYVINR